MKNIAYFIYYKKNLIVIYNERYFIKKYVFIKIFIKNLLNYFWILLAIFEASSLRMKKL